MDETIVTVPYDESSHLPTEFMSLALDGLLEPSQQQGFDAHLSACEMCRSEWLKWRRISNALQAEPFCAPASGFALRVDQVIRRDEKRRERMLGGLVLVSGTLSIWTVLLIGLILSITLGMTVFPEVKTALLEYLEFGGQVAALIVRNLAAIRNGLLASGSGVTAAIAIVLAALALVWLYLVRLAGRQPVASRRHASASNHHQ